MIAGKDEGAIVEDAASFEFAEELFEGAVEVEGGRVVQVPQFLEGLVVRIE